MSPRPCSGHEVDELGRDELGGAHQVALVLAILIVRDDDDLAVAQVLDRLLDGIPMSCLVRLAAVVPQAREVRRQQAIHVLPERVTLDMHPVPGPPFAQVRVLQSKRNQGDLDHVRARASRSPSGSRRRP